MTAFAHDLERWLDTAGDEFALGEDDFNFHLHYEHALRDTAPELWRYGLHLKEELEADLARRAARMDGGPGWQDVADRLRADHPPATALVEAYAREMARARDFVAQRGLAPIPDAQERLDPAHRRGLGAVLRGHDGGGGILPLRGGTVLPARAPAVARRADPARRGAAHPGHDVRAGGRVPDESPGGRPGQRRGGSAALLRRAGVPAVLRRGAARAAEAARRLSRGARGGVHAARVPRRRAALRRPARHADALGPGPE